MSSTAGHTAGPWIAEPGGGKGSWIKGSNGEWAAVSCGNTDASAEANARLIAAAPDMLSALRAVQIAMSIAAALPGVNAEFDFTHALERTRSAIAKATGAS